MILLFACTGADPELEPVARALAAWEHGKAALDAGDPAVARERFAQARAAADAPLLAAWEAKALADMGDLTAAVQLADEALKAAPTLAAARYDRAAWLARLGRLDEAGPELARALADGAADLPTALEDPDFVPHLDHPAFAFLPDQALEVTLEAPPPTAFWGAEVVVGLSLAGVVQGRLSVHSERASGPVELVKGIQSPDRLSWTLRVAGAGPIALGPFTVRAGRHEATAGPVDVAAAAPPDRQQATVPPLRLRTFDQVAEGVAPGRAVKVGDELRARTGPSDRVETEPALPPPARYERREDGRPVELVWVWPAGAEADRVRILGPRAPVFDGPPE